MINNIPGAKLLAFDLHVHTPSSHDFKDKYATASDVVNAALSAGLDAIAITDHNQIDFIDPARKAAEGTFLVVFPGVEISTTGGHLLAIFDPNEPVKTLEFLLEDCEIPQAQYGDPQVIGISLEKAIENVANRGGVAIAAHIELERGFLAAITEGPARERIHRLAGLSALEITVPEDFDLWLSGKHPKYSQLKTPRACIMSSDAHQLSDIGRKRTYLMMETASLDGLRLAFDDPWVNIFLPERLPNFSYPQIVSLRVSQGFLRGTEFDFNPGFTCLVGGKGTGKSTIIELIRYVLDQQSTLKEIREDTHWKLQELVGLGAVITAVIKDQIGNLYEITREYSLQDSSIRVYRLLEGGDKEAIPNISLPHFFRIHAFSQGEATIIARERVSQLQLIDGHINLSQENEELSMTLEGLAQNRNELLSIDWKLSKYDHLRRQEATLSEEIRRKAEQLHSLQEAQENPVLVDHDTWLSELHYTRNVIKGYDEAINDVNEAFRSMVAYPSLIEFPRGQLFNPQTMEQVASEAKQTSSILDEARANLINRLEEEKAKLTAYLKEWKSKYREHERAYLHLQSELEGTNIQALASGLESSRIEHNKIKRNLDELEQYKRNQITYQNQREALTQRIKAIRDIIQTKRERQIEKIRGDIGEVISIGLLKSKNTEAYLRCLRKHLKGSRIQSPTYDKIIENVEPSQLVQLLRNRDGTTLAAQCEIGLKTADTVISGLISKPAALLELEEVICDDLLDIRLRVGSNYRPLHLLSAGQKATVMILLALTEGAAPVIYDQPEDSLDTAFIYSDVVRILRNSKSNRQFIFATHNHNIAVSSHLDYATILDINETAQNTQVIEAGSIDSLETREQLLLHLEGGEDAFLKRGRKYNPGRTM